MCMCSVCSGCVCARTLFMQEPTPHLRVCLVFCLSPPRIAETECLKSGMCLVGFQLFVFCFFLLCWDVSQRPDHRKHCVHSLLSTLRPRMYLSQRPNSVWCMARVFQPSCAVEGTTGGQNELASTGISILGAPPSPHGILITSQSHTWESR